MRKIIVFGIALISLCFLIPIIFTRKFETMESSISVGNEIQKPIEEILVDQSYDYEDFTNIKLLHISNNEIKEVNLDEYLCNVVSAEIPAKYNDEAIKAQAVVARTYTIYTIIKNNDKHGEADLCDSSACCQAWISKEARLAKWEECVRTEYWNKIVAAVNETIGEVITYNGEVINAVYHANSGGKTELASGVWNGGDYPYLQSVETSGEDGYEQYASEVKFSYGELENKIKEKYNGFVFGEDRKIEILEYTSTGRAKTVQIGNVTISGVELRNLLGLKSTNFKIEIAETINFKVTGYGHGVRNEPNRSRCACKSRI